MDKCRVILKEDGTVAVVYPAIKAKKKEETEGKFLDRVYGKALKGTGLESLPYKDMEVSELPDVTKRAKWRHDGTNVAVDESVVLPVDERTALESQLDAELAKSTPDATKALKLLGALRNK